MYMQVHNYVDISMYTALPLARMRVRASLRYAKWTVS